MKISERFNSLKAEFEEQLKEETELNQRIMENLAKVKVQSFARSHALAWECIPRHK